MSYESKLLTAFSREGRALHFEKCGKKVFGAKENKGVKTAMMGVFASIFKHGMEGQLRREVRLFQAQ